MSGEWQELVEPMAKDLALKAQLGLDVKLDQDSALATAQALRMMADLIESQERLNEAGWQLIKSLLWTLGLTVALALAIIVAMAA